MIRYFANHPTAANLMMVAFLVAGLFAAPQLQRETFPRIEPRYVEVTVPFPGASAEDVEEAICQRIEDSLDAVNYIEEVSCEASESVGKAKIKMVEGQNLDRFLSDIKTEVEAIDNFPDETETMIIKQLGRTDFVASVALVGPKRLVDLKAQAEAVKDRMIVWGNISEVTIQGFSDHQIRIELADLTLRQFGLSVEDVADVISRQSVDLPAGDVETRSGQILIRFDDERERVHEFANLVVLGGDQGGQVWIDNVSVLTSDGTELVTNGDFQSGGAGWEGGAATAENIKTHPIGAEGYAEYIDVDSFVDWFLISEITKNVDSMFFSSMFLNVMPGEKIKMGPLWDFDLSFGNVDYADSRYAEGWWVKYHPWYERLFQDPAFVEEVKVRFAFFKGNQDFILNKIDAYAEQLKWAQQENNDKWQTIGQYVWPNPVVFDTYQEEVDHMKEWYINRMNWLDSALDSL